MFETIEGIIASTIILIGALGSLVDKCKKIFRWNYERKNGGNIRQKIDRIEEAVIANKKDIKEIKDYLGGK